MDEIDTDLLEFKLPKQHKPGADRSSRLLALQPEFINLVTAALVDSPTGTYIAAPTTFLNKECDVIYVSKMASILPPIILEFQAKVNLGFIHRAFSYCLEVYKRYNILPIVLVICTDEVDRFLLVEKFKTMHQWSYMLEMECSIVSKHFYLLTKDSIMELVNADEPLPPLVAVAHFLVSGEPSIIGNSRWDDEHIKLLYRLCMKNATQDGTHELSQLDALKRVCIDTHGQFEKIVKSARLDPGRTVRYASAGMEYTSQMARKIDDLLSNENDCITPMEEPDADDLVCDGLTTKSQSDFDKQVILDFVQEFKQKFKGRMNWDVCYAAATKDPSLSNMVVRYSNAVSFKRSYYRLK